MTSPATPNKAWRANRPIGILELRLFGEYNDFDQIKGGLHDYAEFCSYALNHYDSYHLDENIYGDLHPNLRSLSEKLRGRQGASF